MFTIKYTVRDSRSFPSRTFQKGKSIPKFMNEFQIQQEFKNEMISQYKILKSKADRAIEQLIQEDQFNWQPDPDTNSVGIIMRHLSGNMKSRWSDFLTTDGEKASRKRNEEFDEKIILPKSRLFELWNEGWDITFNAIDNLDLSDMMKTIRIRDIEHTVIQALYRQLIHYAEHVGQLYYICKMLTKENWKSLSLPKQRG